MARIILHPSNNKTMQRNNLSDFVRGNQLKINIIVTQCFNRHKFSNGSSMTIMDIGLVTGFKADEKALKKVCVIIVMY